MKLLSYPSILLAAASLVVPSSAIAKKFKAPPMPAGYDDPGPLPEDMLAALIGELRKKLNDPYSIRDFSLCQTRKIAALTAFSPTDPWKRSYWVIHFKLNSKNAFGGYTGLQAGLATIRLGQFDKISLIGSPIEEGPPRDAREPCKQISDDQLQRLLR